MTENKLTAVDSIDRGKGDKECPSVSISVKTIDAESDIEHNGRCIFSAIDKMRKYIACIVVSPNTLKCTPYAWKRGQETKQARVR